MESGRPQDYAQRRGRPEAGTRPRGGATCNGGARDEARIERSALAHLERHSSSVENLRRLLRRRVARWRDAEAADPSSGEAGTREAAEGDAYDVAETPARDESGEDAIERDLARLQRYGGLDDQAYAAGVVRRLRDRGGSTRAIAARLREKGVPDEIARDALGADAGESGELLAACRYARRRRLGPFRASESLRAERREKDLAALGRAGFALETARRVIEAPDRATVLDQLGLPNLPGERS